MVPNEPNGKYAVPRRSWRFRPDGGADAYVEFEFPVGSPWRLSLVSIGEMGIGFALDDGRPDLGVGRRLDPVTVNLGGLRITGSVRTVYVTTKHTIGKVCGAEFTPAEESDKKRMDFLLGRLERRNRRTG